MRLIALNPCAMLYMLDLDLDENSKRANWYISGERGWNERSRTSQCFGVGQQG